MLWSPLLIIKNFSQFQTKFTAYTDSEVVLAWIQTKNESTKIFVKRLLSCKNQTSNRTFRYPLC